MCFCFLYLFDCSQAQSVWVVCNFWVCNFYTKNSYFRINSVKLRLMFSTKILFCAKLLTSRNRTHFIIYWNIDGECYITVNMQYNIIHRRFPQRSETRMLVESSCWKKVKGSNMTFFFLHIFFFCLQAVFYLTCFLTLKTTPNTIIAHFKPNYCTLFNTLK